MFISLHSDIFMNQALTFIALNTLTIVFLIILPELFMLWETLDENLKSLEIK